MNMLKTLALLVTIGGLSYGQQTPPAGLKILSATYAPETRKVSVKVQNVTDKTIVAYVLETEGFDAQGNKVGEFRQDFDYIGPEPNPTGRAHFIQPKGIGTAEYARPEAPDPRILNFHPEAQAGFDEATRKALALDAMTSVRVSVLEVVYEDRTCEGNACTIGDIFDGRRRKAASRRQVLKTTLKDYPATEEARVEAMRFLQILGFNPPEELRTRQHWETVRAEVQRDAEWWDVQSQPQGAAK